MADLLNIRFEGDRGFVEGQSFSHFFDMKIAERLLRNAVDDIADAIEAQVQRTVPVGETGRLKLHPIDREDTRISLIPGRDDPGFGTRTGIAAFGGGASVRGPGGRFIRPQDFRAPIFTPDELIARSTITVAREPKHAIFVHDGTGIFGPTGKPITTEAASGRLKFMRFTWQGKKFRLKVVKGQRAQPYLDKAFLLINGTYVPRRIEILRAQIAAET